MFTILQYKQRIEGLKVVIVGDILHSRVARSNIWGLKTLGADVHVAGPATLLAREMESMGITVHTSVEEAIEDADVLNVLRIQKNARERACSLRPANMPACSASTAKRLKLAKPDALVLHPGPMNRGLEIAPDVAYGDQSAIQEQVKNGLAIRMAILYLVLMGGEEVETIA
jgi:aspartate carbamoyltransferase catalytic subunit